MKKQP